MALSRCGPTHPDSGYCFYDNFFRYFYLITELLSYFYIFMLVKGFVIAFIYTYMNPRTLLICDTCSKAEYTRFISLCSVSVPYVRLYNSMGLGYIIADSCQSGIYGPISLVICHHPG